MLIQLKEDDHCPQDHADVDRLPARGVVEVLRVDGRQFVPRDQGGKFHPTVGGVEFTLEGGVEPLEAELALGRILYHDCTGFDINLRIPVHLGNENKVGLSTYFVGNVCVKVVYRKNQQALLAFRVTSLKSFCMRAHP